MSVKPVVDTQVNIVALIGHLQRAPQCRELKSGDCVTNFDVKVKDQSGVSSLPVSWFDAPESAMAMKEGDLVAVVERMRRQWCGSGANFTDVVATSVVPARSRSRLRKVLAEAMVSLQQAAS